MSSLTVIAASLVLLACAIGAERLVGFDPSLPGAYSRLELVPYILLLAGSIGFAWLWLARRGRFSLLNPLVHVGWTYLFPILVGGSMLYVAVGISDTPEHLIRRPAIDYRLTLVYLAIGVAALALGLFAAPFRLAGMGLGRILPSGLWSLRETEAAGLILLLVGTAIQYVNFQSGLIGYQRGAAGPFTALFYYLGLTFQMGLFLLWFALFSAPNVRSRQVGLGLLSLLAMTMVAMLAGSRGLLVSCWIVMVLACAAACPRPSLRQIGFLAVAGLLALVLGFTLGTLFRQIKSGTIEVQEASRPVPRPVAPETAAPPVTRPGSAPAGPPPQTSQDVARFGQRSLTLAEQADTVGRAVAAAGSGHGVPLVVRAFAARTNVLTQITVLVSQRDALLQSMPASLRSSIFIGIATSLVPRALWPDKPIIGDAASHARLFFQFENNSFAVTPVGDLILNFGPAGIVPGMLCLGALFAVLYGCLVEAMPGSAVRSATMVVLLTQFSMEGFFATIVPSLLRAGLVAVIAGAAVHLGIIAFRRMRPA